MTDIPIVWKRSHESEIEACKYYFQLSSNGRIYASMQHIVKIDFVVNEYFIKVRADVQLADPENHPALWIVQREPKHPYPITRDWLWDLRDTRLYHIAQDTMISDSWPYGCRECRCRVAVDQLPFAEGVDLFGLDEQTMIAAAR